MSLELLSFGIGKTNISKKLPLLSSTLTRVLSAPLSMRGVLFEIFSLPQSKDDH
jgi:hypothetical protein